MIEKTGMMESKPNSVYPVAARRAMASGLRQASGNGASTRSISSTVATDVGLHAGVRSTGSRRSAASTRSRLVIVFVVAVVAGIGSPLIGSFLGAGRHENAARSSHLFFAQSRSHVQRARQEKTHNGIVRLAAGECNGFGRCFGADHLRKFGESVGDRGSPRSCVVAAASGDHLVSPLSLRPNNKFYAGFLIENLQRALLWDAFRLQLTGLQKDAASS